MFNNIKFIYIQHIRIHTHTHSHIKYDDYVEKNNRITCIKSMC